MQTHTQFLLLGMASIWCPSLKKWPLQAKVSSQRNQGMPKANHTILCPQSVSKPKATTSTVLRAKGQSIHELDIQATLSLFISEGEEL